VTASVSRLRASSAARAPRGTSNCGAGTAIVSSLLRSSIGARVARNAQNVRTTRNPQATWLYAGCACRPSSGDSKKALAKNETFNSSRRRTKIAKSPELVYL
jgi:hypothetical protein